MTNAAPTPSTELPLALPACRAEDMPRIEDEMIDGVPVAADGEPGPTAERGPAINKAMEGILERCEDAGNRLSYPGEGGERPFRGWLSSDLLAGVFGWPNAKIVIGERFDVLLQDQEGFPVATIETKAPGHAITDKDRGDFESRLQGFPTTTTLNS